MPFLPSLTGLEIEISATLLKLQSPFHLKSIHKGPIVLSKMDFQSSNLHSFSLLFTDSPPLLDEGAQFLKQKCTTFWYFFAWFKNFEGISHQVWKSLKRLSRTYQIGMSRHGLFAGKFFAGKSSGNFKIAGNLPAKTANFSLCIMYCNFVPKC